jgi:hypothetical protein
MILEETYKSCDLGRCARKSVYDEITTRRDGNLREGVGSFMSCPGRGVMSGYDYSKTIGEDSFNRGDTLDLKPIASANFR